MTLQNTQQALQNIDSILQNNGRGVIDTVRATEIVNAFEQDLFANLNNSLTFDQNAMTTFRQRYSQLQQIIASVRQQNQRAVDDLFNRFSPAGTPSTAKTHADVQNYIAAATTATPWVNPPNPALLPPNRRGYASIPDLLGTPLTGNAQQQNNQIRERSRQTDIIQWYIDAYNDSHDILTQINSIYDAVANTWSVYHTFRNSLWFNFWSSLRAQTVDAQGTIPNVDAQAQFRMPTAPVGQPTYRPINLTNIPLPNPTDPNNPDTIDIAWVTIDPATGQISFANVHVVRPANFTTYPVSISLDVIADIVSTVNLGNPPVATNITSSHTKQLPLTIRQGNLPLATQETVLAGMRPQIDIIASGVWNSPGSGYNATLRRQVDQLLTNNGMTTATLQEPQRTRLLDALMANPAITGLYMQGWWVWFLDELVTAPVHPVWHPQAWQASRVHSALFLPNQRVTQRAYEDQIRASLGNGTLITNARDFLEKRVLQLLSEPAVMSIVMAEVHNQTATMMNTMQYLTTATAQNLLQNDLQYFEQNRGQIHPVGTIAERYRWNPLVRGRRNFRDRCNGESPRRSHLRTVVDRENPASHNYMAYFAGMDTVANPMTHNDVILPWWIWNVTIQTWIRMHNYQQIVPQIRIGWAINHVLDARFTHDGSLQGIVEGILRPETQIPGADDASAYVIKSHIIMTLYKTYVQEMIQRMGSFQDYGNPRTQMTLENGVLRITQWDQIIFDEDQWRETGQGMPIVAAQRHQLMNAYNQNYVEGMTERPRHMAQSRLRRLRYRNRLPEENRLDFVFKSGEGDNTIFGNYEHGQMRLQIPQRDETTQEILRDEEGNIMYHTIPANPGRRSRGMDMDRIFAMPELYGRQHEVMKAFYWKYLTELFHKPRVRNHHSRFTISSWQQAGGIKAFGVRYNGRMYIITHTGMNGLMMGEMPLEWAQPHLDPESGVLYPAPNNYLRYDANTAGQILTNPLIMNRFIEHMVGQM
jgi:hypothetical protein